MTPTDHGQVFWITGVTGTGKTTVGELLHRRLLQAGRNAVFLDGDALRATISDDLGYSAADRRTSALRNSRLCRLIAAQGADVVCSTISLFHEVQQWNRENIAVYREIYLRAPREELERRDSKQIYSRVRSGSLKDVTGVDIQAEEPRWPDLTFDNWGDVTPQEVVEKIWTSFVDLGCGAAPIAAPPKRAGQLTFSTKAETLERLVGQLRTARVLPQVRFTVAEWMNEPAAVIAKVQQQSWHDQTKIVRSSASGEDSEHGSLAGKFRSVGNVNGPRELRNAIEDVVSSYGENRQGADQVFIQPWLANVRLAGVILTQDTNSGGPYIVINYDDYSHRADEVTSGRGGDLKTYFWHRSGRVPVPAALQSLPPMISELEALFSNDRLDIEFAVDGDGVLTILQARPLAITSATAIDTVAHAHVVGEIAQKIDLLSRRHPYLHGERSVYGVMPDWNPAEIVGLKPKPLSLSLYRELVTDEIWAYQRDNYGYKNLRSFPLLVNFHGLPYIDVRVSFNSFIPQDVDGALAERLVTYYIDRLLEQPTLHDKVEFEIIFSCYTADIAQRIGVLRRSGFSEDDVAQLTESLRALTNRIIHPEKGLWRLDREKIDILADRLPAIRQSGNDKISRIYWLLEDCKRYGTLPFAGLARAGFVAVQLLRSLVAVGILNEAEYAAFLTSLETVGSSIGRDIASMTREQFLMRYGHLRPGTYDILSARYDEDPERYFDWSAERQSSKLRPTFALSMQQMRRIEQMLKEHRLEHDAIGFMEFIQAGIEGREYAKFVFTRHLSDALVLIGELGKEHGISKDDCAYLDISSVRALYAESASVSDRLRHSVEAGKRHYHVTQSIVLPPLVADPQDCWGFHLPAAQPNFVTQKHVTGAVATLSSRPEELSGKILCIPSADPGFDWIFTRNIAGFVTQFGGVNSHMAIRAGELDMPAVIGCGESLYRRWSAARRLTVDCGSRQVLILA